MAITAGFMVPHPPIAVKEIGRGEEGKIQATLDSFDRVAKKIAELKPETIVVISPHATAYADFFHISPGSRARGDFSQFMAPQVRFDLPYDKEFSDIESASPGIIGTVGAA